MERLSNANFRGLPGAALDKLDFAVAQFFADGDPEGNADQVGVFELHAGPLVAIVEQGVESRRLAFARKAVSAASR